MKSSTEADIFYEATVIAMKALRKIANCNESNVVKYIQYVDSIALDTLFVIEEKIREGVVDGTIKTRSKL